MDTIRDRCAAAYPDVVDSQRNSSGGGWPRTACRGCRGCAPVLDAAAYLRPKYSAMGFWTLALGSWNRSGEVRCERTFVKRKWVGLSVSRALRFKKDFVI